MVWFFSLAFGADCVELQTPDALDAALATADSAISALDVDALGQATMDLEHTLGCQAQAIRVEQAASVHRVRGIAAFVGGDEATANLWFSASRALDPSAPLGHDIGGPVTALWNRSVSASAPERSPLPPPKSGVLFVDGQALSTRPSHLPWVFQHVDGAEITTTLQLPDAPLPNYPGKPREVVERRGKPFTVAAVTAGGLSLASLAGAAWTRERYRRTDLSDAQVAPLLPANRALGVTGWGLVGASAGLVSVAIVQGEW